jgi:putative flippase GtrA
VGAMLARNTVVSCLTFVVGLASLWAMVRYLRIDEVLAAGIGFALSQTLHYGLGRNWIFRGTDRAVATGYAYFLVNSGVGLGLTVGLYALMLDYTNLNYLIARVIVSVFAGLATFLLNAVLNFRQV